MERPELGAGHIGHFCITMLLACAMQALAIWCWATENADGKPSLRVCCVLFVFGNLLSTGE